MSRVWFRLTRLRLVPRVSFRALVSCLAFIVIVGVVVGLCALFVTAQTGLPLSCLAWVGIGAADVDGHERNCLSLKVAVEIVEETHESQVGSVLRD